AVVAAYHGRARRGARPLATAASCRSSGMSLAEQIQKRSQRRLGCLFACRDHPLYVDAPGPTNDGQIALGAQSARGEGRDDRDLVQRRARDPAGPSGAREERVVRSIRMSRYGGPEVLEVAEAPRPAPAADQVLVRVAYAGVNFADVTLRRSGEAAPQPLPLVPGLEAAGIVEAIGPSVTGLQVGQRVAALSWSLGAYAEWLCTSAALAFPLPEDMALADGAAILLQGVTCHYLLHDAFAVGPGSTVLVHAAAGGMGTLLCQWASRLGARVLGTVSTPAKAEVARAAGAEQVVLYERDDFLEAVRAWTGGEGVDYVIDGVGRA